MVVEVCRGRATQAVSRVHIRVFSTLPEMGVIASASEHTDGATATGNANGDHPRGLRLLLVGAEGGVTRFENNTGIDCSWPCCCCLNDVLGVMA
jgi:hypothetical protein